MDKERLQNLEWFVQFANMDFDDLKPGDKAKLIVEAEEYLFGINEWETFNIIDQELKKDFSAYQAHTKPVIFPQKDSDEYWDLIYALHILVNDNFSMIIDGFPPGRPNYFPLTQQGWNMDETQEIMVFFYSDGNKFRFISIPVNQTPDHYISMKIYKSFDGLSLTTLKRCPGCERFFLNFSQREKRFCSPKCMWRVTAEERRRELKKNPKKYKEYLKKQKEIMRRKYEEKRKAELGNKVKVRKRKGV